MLPPSDWTGALAARSAEADVTPGLRLERVHGYEGRENTATNVFCNSLGHVVYYIAAIGVVLDTETQRQSFFTGHCDDIRCMAMHPGRR